MLAVSPVMLTDCEPLAVTACDDPALTVAAVSLAFAGLALMAGAFRLRRRC